MARPTKQGLDYFPFDVGFFGDKNIRILKARYRSDGIAVYIKLLCDIYKEGYFLPIECWEDYIFVIADEIGATVDKVEQVISFLHNRAMVRIYRNDELTGYDLDAVITSHGIQKRYAAAMKSRRKKSVDEIKRGFWLLSEDEEKEITAFYKCGNNDSFSENNPDKSDINTILPEENPLKESKNENNIISIFTDVHAKQEQAKVSFFSRYPKLKPLPGVDDSAIDYNKLSARFAASKKFLQTRRGFAWVVEHYGEILSGKYDDFPEAEKTGKPAPALPAAVQAANAKAAREKFHADRRNAAITAAERIEKQATAIPAYATVIKEIRQLELDQVKAELNAPCKVDGILRTIRAKIKLKVEILESLGLTEQDLLPKWYCPKCSDTGFLPNGAACDCYDNAQGGGRVGDAKTT